MINCNYDIMISLELFESLKKKKIKKINWICKSPYCSQGIKSNSDSKKEKEGKKEASASSFKKTGSLVK